GQNPHATSAPAEVVAGVEGYRSGLALGIGRVEELLISVLQPALDGPQAPGAVAPLRFLAGLASWSTRHTGVLLRFAWGNRVGFWPLSRLLAGLSRGNVSRPVLCWPLRSRCGGKEYSPDTAAFL